MEKENCKKLLKYLINLEHKSSDEILYYCNKTHYQTTQDIFEVLSNENILGIKTKLNCKFIPLIIEILHCSYCHSFEGDKLMYYWTDNLDVFIDNYSVDFMSEFEKNNNEIKYRTLGDNEYFIMFETIPRQKYDVLCVDTLQQFYSLENILEYYF